jgi:hypothetical protein
MRAHWQKRTPLAVAVVLAVAALIVLVRTLPATAEKDTASTGGARYSVVETEGHNLIVTDNQTNTLYFYTVDRDKEVGSDLKLRASLDLTQVGKPVIKPMKPKE